MPKIVAHTLVRNEARWIWFALTAVLDFVDEVMVWDTGSDDATPDIIKLVASPKIKYEQIGPVDAIGHTKAREAMLSQTDSDWILILDGDEIWYRQSLNKCLELIREKPDISAIISPFINPVGDIYHVQNPKRSRYQIGRYGGAYNLRFINRKIPGLHVANPHGRQEYRDNSDTALQNFPEDKLQMVNFPYLHTTHLLRSDSKKSDTRTLKRDFKYRYEWGHRFPEDFVYPEVLYLPRPGIIPDPWTSRGIEYIAKNLIYEPGRFVKNLVSGQKSGY